MPPLHIEIFIFEKHRNLDFWCYFKVLPMGRFWQFWAKFTVFTVAESLSKAWLKSSKPMTLNP
jgi:hypothetical protein